MVKKLLFVLLIAYCPATAFAEHQHKEKEYQQAWCGRIGGVTEYVLDDRTRVDCLTDEYAIEFDFAKKWAESVGQSLYYAEMTGRRPGIVLILEDPTDKRYLARLNKLSDKLNIKVWTMVPDELIVLPNNVPKAFSTMLTAK